MLVLHKKKSAILCTTGGGITWIVYFIVLCQFAVRPTFESEVLREFELSDL